jgi:sulfonate transport system ATP-binding protein
MPVSLPALSGEGPGDVPGSAGPAAVEVRGARRSYGERIVLDGIDLAIGPGEFVALLGQSGSGKSTLLRAIAGLDPMAVGHFEVAPRLGVVFQEHRLLPWKRVWCNVALGLAGPDAAGRARAALEEVGLAERADAWPLTLSGGEAQRAALARALVREPQVLLLDEPFGALDALTRIKVQGLLSRLCEAHRPAVLLVTHDVDEALLLADRVAVLTDGRLSLDVAVGRPDEWRRGVARFDDLRRRLLAELGVDDVFH